MLDQTLKTAFMAQAEKLAPLAPLTALLKKRLPPAILACYPTAIFDSQEYAPDYDWQSIGFVAARYFNLEAVLALPIMLTRLAFVAPEETFATMDALAEGWLLGETSSTPPPPTKPGQPISSIERKIPTALQKLFWQQVEVGDNVIENVFNYPVVFEPDLTQAYEVSMSQHAGIPEAFQQGYLRGTMKIQDLQDYPKGTLGWSYYHQIVDNGLGIEILKGNQQKARSGDLIDYVNQRILQTHDLWHCLTCYSTDGIEEIALQAFQMAQLGTPFSPSLLAITMTQAVLFEPETVRPLMHVICAGWQHGRNTPPLLPVKWEQHWAQTLDEIRQERQIAPVR